LALFTEWDRGNARDTFFYNNIFYVDGRVTYNFGKSQNTVFESNIFFGSHTARPPDISGSTNQPALLNPGSGRNGLDSLGGYKLRDGDACVPGRLVPENGGRDFFGNPVPTNRPPCAGAAQP
jgi:hypothetical protein